MTRNLNLDNFFDDFEVKFLQTSNFSEKQFSFKLQVICSTNFRPKTKKIVRAVFEKNIKVSDFGLIWRPFCEYLQIKNFFQKSDLVTFLTLHSSNAMQKILRAVSEKTALSTNQPTNQLLPTTPILQDRDFLVDAGLKRERKCCCSEQYLQKIYKIRQNLLLKRFSASKFVSTN